MRISDYIMEQEISTASCDDIEIAKCFAEMEVLGSIVECYAKQAMIMEYYEGDVSEFGIFQEATNDETNNDSDSEKKRNVFKRMGSAIWNALKKVGEMFLKIFTKADFKQMIKITEKLPDKIEMEMPARKDSSIHISDMTQKFFDIINAYKKFTDLLTEQSNDVNKYKAITEDLKFKNTEYGQWESSSLIMSHVVISKQDLIKVLKDLDEAGVVPSVRKQLKKIDLSKKTGLGAGDKGAVLVSTIKDTASTLVKEFNNTNKILINMQNAIIKKAYKDQRAETQEGKKAVREAQKDIKREQRNERKHKPTAEDYDAGTI